MSEARDQILGDIRARLGRGRLDAAAGAAVEERLAAHRRNLVPARAAALDHAGQVALFVAEAEAVDATVVHVARAADVPAAVADYLSRQNLPARLVMTLLLRTDVVMPLLPPDMGTAAERAALAP